MHYEHFLYLKNFSEMSLEVGGVTQKPLKWPFWLYSLTSEGVIGVGVAKRTDLQPTIYIRTTEKSCFQTISSLTLRDIMFGSWVCLGI